MIKRLVIFISIIVLLDTYILLGYKNLFTNTTYKAVFKWFYIISMIISYGTFALMILKIDAQPVRATLWMNLLFGYTFAFIALRLGLFITLVIDDVVRIVEFIGLLFKRILISADTDVSFSSRRNFIRKIGLGLASIPFASMLYGITKGKYNYKVKKVVLKFENLPKAFYNFTITHLSDIHSGSFDSFEDVERGVKMAQDLKSDVILFTGDFINQDAKELEPYIQLFKNLKAPFGKFSSLGNHDYGTHKRWSSKAEKEINFKTLKHHEAEMDFHLLNNDASVIEKEGDKIQIVGVENWGKPPFPQFGDLDVALEKVDDKDFKVLLSHDPSHWDEKIIPHQTRFDLTLSGHTHGMQFGIEIPGFKWSPSKYIYKRWAGLYKNNKQYLYVNRGFGFLGFPGRVGIWPEITQITLQKA